MCNTGVSLHNYVEDAYCGCFAAHLSERCVVWVFHCISVLKICVLGTLLHICIFLHSNPCMSILKMYSLGVSMHIYLKDVYFGCLPVHLT